MRHFLPALIVGFLCAGSAAAQSSASAQAGASTQSQASASTNAGKGSVELASGTKIDASLVQSLDAKKSKPGDRVEARTAQDVKQDGKVILKKGTFLVGHVTQAQARTKEQSQSQLGIVFDHAVLKNREEIPLPAIIQALALSQSSASAALASDDAFSGGGSAPEAPGTSAGGGLLGGVTSTAGGAAGGVANTASSTTGSAGGNLSAATRSVGAVGGLTSFGRLASNSSGIFGLEGLSIDLASSNATEGTMIISPSKNVHLDGGTQMLLSVAGQAQ